MSDRLAEHQVVLAVAILIAAWLIATAIRPAHEPAPPPQYHRDGA